jgi:hypothetical protein
MFQSFLSAQERLRARPLRYLFVLGHVRSGSSLLVHLLTDVPPRFRRFSPENSRIAYFMV